MGKLSLKTAKKAVGIGTFVEKTIKFRGADGEECEGEVLIKIATHDEIVNSTNVYNLKDRSTVTMDQLRKSHVYLCVYESENKPFFPTIESTGEVSSEVLIAMHEKIDEVLDFSGKNWILNQKKNSGANSSSMELAEEQ